MKRFSTCYNAFAAVVTGFLAAKIDGEQSPGLCVTMIALCAVNAALLLSGILKELERPAQ